MIVEYEQNGNERAEYGKAVLEGLSKKLTVEFADDADVKAIMKQVLKNCKKIESDCDIEF